MAYKIEWWCSSCGLCPTQCPANCIKSGFPYVIDEKACTSCGICENICPTGAAVPKEEEAENQNMY